MERIIIVDDSEDIVDSLKTLVESLNKKTETAFNGEELIKKVDKFNPDLVFLDVMMPGMKTKEILEKLNKLNDPKVVLITVVRFSEEEIKSLKAKYNVVGYVKKPFSIDEIIKIIK